MKCGVCGSELKGNEKYCENCGALVEEAGQGAVQTQTEVTSAMPGGAFQGEGVPTGADYGVEPAPKPKKNTGILIGAVAAVAAAGALAFAFLSPKDPKEVVIAAFENIYPEGQTSPMEEVFGLSGFQEKVASSDMETSVTPWFWTAAPMLSWMNSRGAGSGSRLRRTGQIRRHLPI